MIKKKTIFLAIVLIVILIIKLNDGLTKKEIREQFRSALNKRRFKSDTSYSSNDEENRKETTTADSASTFEGKFKLEQTCDKGDLSLLSSDTIKSKIFFLQKYISETFSYKLFYC